MKAGLKGGLIGLGVLILQLTISFICAAIMAPKCGECSVVCMFPFYLNMYLFSWIPSGIMYVLIQIITYFLIGTLIGFIIGIIKSHA